LGVWLLVRCSFAVGICSVFVVIVILLYAFRLILAWSGFVFVQMVMMSNWFVFF
jgi:hypothetical protein